MTYWVARGENDAATLAWCPTCRGKWSLYLGAYDRDGNTMRCSGCLRIPDRCTCR